MKKKVTRLKWFLGLEAVNINVRRRTTLVEQPESATITSAKPVKVGRSSFTYKFLIIRDIRPRISLNVEFSS